jgi:hypothetical protein
MPAVVGGSPNTSDCTTRCRYQHALPNRERTPVSGRGRRQWPDSVRGTCGPARPNINSTEGAQRSIHKLVDPVGGVCR